MYIDQWNLVLERIEHSDGQQDTISYVWGKDLSGTPQGAGGIGGLLWMKFNDTLYIPCYDSNGNITQYIDGNGTPVATFTYDPFGRTTTQTGTLSFHLSFRFSTKYYDPETDLYYYGYRFYSPHLMRWLNRDTLEELSGKNLFCYLSNNTVNGIEYLGLSKVINRTDTDIVIIGSYTFHYYVKIKSNCCVKNSEKLSAIPLSLGNGNDSSIYEGVDVDAVIAPDGHPYKTGGYGVYTIDSDGVSGDFTYKVSRGLGSKYGKRLDDEMWKDGTILDRCKGSFAKLSDLYHKMEDCSERNKLQMDKCVFFQKQIESVILILNGEPYHVK